MSVSHEFREAKDEHLHTLDDASSLKGGGFRKSSMLAMKKV